MASSASSAHAGHQITRCVHGVLHSQCRCPDLNKTVVIIDCLTIPNHGDKLVELLKPDWRKEEAEVASEMRQAIHEYLDSLHSTTFGEQFTITESRKRREQCADFIEKLVRDINRRHADKLIVSDQEEDEPAALDDDALRRSEAALTAFNTDPSSQRSRSGKRTGWQVP